MRLSTVDRVLLACVVGCATIVVLQCRALAGCDNSCRYIKIYGLDDGDQTWECFNTKNYDCIPCDDPGGGCSDQLTLQKGSCQADNTLPQELAVASDCSLVCPLPPKGRCQANGTPGTNFFDFDNTFTCQGAQGS